MSKIFKSLIFFAIILVFCVPARAAISDPELFFKEKVDELYTILNDENLDEERQYEEINAFVEKSFCLDQMCCYVMRSKWKKLNDQEKENFKKYFTMLITNYYLNKVRQYYKEWQIEILPANEEDKTKDRLPIIVKASQNGFEDVFINFSLYFISGEWKLYNIKAVGVSFLTNFQSQINSDNKKNREKLAEILKGNWERETQEQ